MVSMMLNSNKHKLELSSWLERNQIKEFSRHLKLQKFIFFYESFTKLDDEIADFTYLRAYLNGPVYSDVFGDYQHRSELFVSTLSSIGVSDTVNDERAKLAGFIVKILNEDELSDLTHEFNPWKVKEGQIKKGYKQIPMSESDFTEDDFKLLETLKEMYPLELIEEVEVVSVGKKNFLISKEDMAKLTDDQENIFIDLAENPDLYNPVYVSLTDDGVLLVD